MEQFELHTRVVNFYKLFFAPFCIVLFLISCNEHKNVHQKEIVASPADINSKAEDLIKGTLKDILQNNKELPDSFKVKNASILQYLYDQNSYQPQWSSSGKFTVSADSLLHFIGNAKEYGLFPNDYYFNRLSKLEAQLSNTSDKEKKLDASLWAYHDMLMSSAFVQIIKDVKAGRLLPDSVVMRDSLLKPNLILAHLNSFKQNADLSFLQQLEPNNADYQKLKTALQNFLEKAKFKNYTFVSTKDSTQLPKIIYKRLSEEDSTLASVSVPDSLQLSDAIKKYEKRKELKADGKISSALITKLNDNDKEKFIRIAINLDRYKQLPPLPVQYIWVNLASYYLQVKDSDSVVLKSRVVVGKPTTKTPIITSAISDMITYPQWHIPESIIKKEILPGLKRDATYTVSKGYSLLDKDGNEVDPTKVNWAKFTNSIPYKVIQGSGDANALGVLKFNFPNDFSVYLHDTNQRYLFGNKNRALSHGCVRVQAWKQLADYILRNDSTYSANAVPLDSLNRWLAVKQKKYIPVRKPIPLFIRYFTCDVAEDGHVVFYDDVYGEDKRLTEKFFANKTIQ